MDSENCIQNSVCQYYSEALKDKENSKSCPLKPQTSPIVCCGLSKIHPDVMAKSLSCGLPFPDAVDGCKILDLGSGAGRDVFLLANLAGPNGHVTGVDMNEDMLKFSREFAPYHAKKFGYETFEFKFGILEKLDEVDGLNDSSLDIVISNCVICLCSDKTAVLHHVYNLLKPGGELIFSDIFAEEPLAEELRQDPTIWNEGFGGAFIWEEFKNLASEIGFLGPLVLDESPYEPKIEELKTTLAGKNYWAKTIRLFKLPGNISEESEHKDMYHVTYQGKIPGRDQNFTLAKDAIFKEREKTAVSKEVWQALKHSRFVNFFTFD